VEKMQLSYKVIKSSNVDSNSVYTIKAPVIHIKPACPKKEQTNKDYAQEAKDIISEAEAKSKMMIDSAAKKAEGIKREAYDMASKKGYNDGLKKGIEEGFKKTEATRKDAENVLIEAHRASRQYIEKQKGEIVELAVSIAEKIIGYQADTNDSVILKMVNDSINRAVVKGQVIIRVNPMDYAILDSKMDELVKSAGENTSIDIIKDNAVNRGGCTINTGLSTVDASIDSQLEKIKQALME
jgi:flagellar assembly protein FliH